MTLVPHGKELTTQQAADLLHVSRPHLLKLLDERVIDHYKVGSHRRVRIEDFLAYRESRASRRREKLDELTRLSKSLRAATANGRARGRAAVRSRLAKLPARYRSPLSWTPASSVPTAARARNRHAA